MMDTDRIKAWTRKVTESIEANTFVRLTLSQNRDAGSSLKKVLIRLALIKKAPCFSVVFRHDTKDITKNYPVAAGTGFIEQLLAETFRFARLFTTRQDFILEIKGAKIRSRTEKPTFKTRPELTHDKPKNMPASETGYLRELDILDGAGRVKKDKGDKLKQIRKFVEIIDGLWRKNDRLSQKDTLEVFDMGAGKGYLTFALYDFLANQVGRKTRVTGVELRDHLIQKGNDIARKTGFEGLSFVKGFIHDFDLPRADILMALHACDTATDDAIFKGIRARAEVIICAPCCHKQIRKQLHPGPPLDILTQYGILKERQAEMVTDAIRAQLLEAFGYETKVFEFISTEHTGKNVMIVGQYHGDTSRKADFLVKVAALKQTFGIEYHYLEKLLGLYVPTDD
ncbi:MAG: SAM-dependent methyltransferase [Bacteroidetes bacterium]|nr:MAG: SAM-dependent methyltransferase [Bacteroidota bacterium]